MSRLRFFAQVVSLGVMGVTLTLACALATAWWWSGTEGSLAQTLQSLAPQGWLNRLARQTGVPLGQLSTLDVTGSLRFGGRVGALQWQQQPEMPVGIASLPGISLDVRGLQLQWNTPALLDGRLEITQLAVKRFSVNLPSHNEPTAPLQAVLLPLPVNVNFNVQQLEVKGAVAVTLDDLQGSYIYDSNKAISKKDISGFLHKLVLTSIRLAQGQYQLNAQVQAQAPMALQATLEGRVKSVVPGGVAITVLANAAVSGTLAGEQATLDVQAQARREDPPSPTALKSNAPPVRGLPTLNATARILPWAVQPIHSARLALAQLNLADFWPQAPSTRLSGTVQADPKTSKATKDVKDAKDAKGQDWVADIALTNTNPGPWDRQRLPVQSLKAQVFAAVDAEPQQQAQGTRWVVSALQAHAGDGELQGQGRWQGGTGAEPWQGKITFNRINPAALYSAMAQARLDGSATAVQQGAGTAFEIKLKSSAGRESVPAALQGFSLGDAHAAGQWAGDSLRLSDFTLQAAQAKIQAKGELHIAARSFSGNLEAQFPGGSAGFQGLLKADALSLPPSDAKLNMTLAQADVTWAWLKTLPQMQQLLATITPNLVQWAVKGQADMTLDWQGVGRLVNARLSVPTLVLQPPAEVTVNATGLHPEPLKFSALQLSAQGPLSALAVVADGVAEQAPYKVQLGSRAVLSLATSPQEGVSGQGTFDMSRLNVQLQDSARSLAWALQSDSTNANDRALKLRWKDGSFEALPGQLRLVPQDLGGNTAPRLLPSDKAVTLAWDQMLWDTQGLHTQGRLSQLPLTWIDWLAGPKAQPLADMGLSGQLWFDGDWDVFWPRDVHTPVRLSAGLQRQRGTLSVLLDDGSFTALGQAGAKPVDVGLREASLRVTTVPGASSGAMVATGLGTSLQARLRWNTDRAGVVDAELSTVLQANPTQSGWAWSDNAPLRGTVTAQLPQIGVWSLLAPPGWRMKGTLAAQATISGTKATPQWAGQVQADQLALRSVVDGIEFVNGQLRANLNGDNAVIERFTLEGAGGASTGGRLTATGAAQWELDRAITPSANAKPKRIPRIDLQVTLDKLRVSNRADRRLVISGQAQAQLAGAQLKLRGKLRADQAAFTLTDELTPRLGDDVVVQGRKLATSSSEPGTTLPTATKVIPDVLLDLDLGDNFAVEGSGLKARLQGTLQVLSTPSQPLPRLLGEVRTTSGSYRAYGVNLNLETGLLRFAGPYDNPTLDILAIRPNITQRVGVQVTGTAQVPVLRLYAEPELPDTEKLSWLVLGRSATGPGGDAAILQQAAMSLLGRPGSRLDGGIAGALGLDDVSYRSGGLNADGSVTSAAVSVGKRLSSKLYVVYGQSLTSSVGTVSILYELSRRLTLRAKTGEDNVLELVFTVRYD